MKSGIKKRWKKNPYLLLLLGWNQRPVKEENIEKQKKKKSVTQYIPKKSPALILLQDESKNHQRLNYWNAEMKKGEKNN